MTWLKHTDGMNLFKLSLIGLQELTMKIIHYLDDSKIIKYTVYVNYVDLIFWKCFCKLFMMYIVHHLYNESKL